MSCGTVEISSGNPPWYVMDENDQIMPLEVPSRLKEHPELVRRGLEPVDPSKIGVVYRTSVLKEPLYYIKIVNTDTEEAAVYQRLSQRLASPNHTIPGELTPNETGHPLLIMPAMSHFGFLILTGSSLYDTLAMFLQVIEGLEYMHSLHIAHMDVCPANIVAAPLSKDQPYPDVEPGKMYYIDFGSSLQLPFGPGVQTSVPLGPSQYALEYGIHDFDPYSWDVYCAALTLRHTLKVHNSLFKERTINRFDSLDISPGALALNYSIVPRARQVLTGILWGLVIWDSIKNMVHHIAKVLWWPFSP
ncbi:hypothetical protein ACG7TL_001791 [Trametes sanguinea]